MLLEHDVDLEAEHDDDGHRVEEDQQAEDDGEDGVEVARPLDDRADVHGTDRLHPLPGQRREHGARQHVGEAQRPGRRDDEDQPDDERVEPDRGDGDRPARVAAGDEPLQVGRQTGRQDDRQAGDGQQEQATGTAGEGVGPGVARDHPGGVARVLQRLPDAEPAVERREPTDEQTHRPTAEGAGRPQLVADDRELRQRRVEDAVLPLRLPLEDEADRSRQQQQRGEERQEPVVREQCAQVAAEVVEELVDDRDGEADERVTTLDPVDRTDAGLAHSRPSAGRDGPRHAFDVAHER